LHMMPSPTIPPIAAFVAAGFEHSIANVYFISMGLFIKLGAPQYLLGLDR
jgi:formate transporter